MRLTFPFSILTNFFTKQEVEVHQSFTDKETHITLDQFEYKPSIVCSDTKKAFHFFVPHESIQG
jgi:hypothetical protein